ncbi:MFS transporter [Thermoflavimicrobium dichotomicum]|uniref:MFS transporter, YNFM family, putative membrane transport protein n=1 Tax=Thermoflavimicrobium dichotomicum TaxID=46223 RepID=A0A1I3UCG4_9BACL|nr:MFS transporter [Thermoflavimicrobium dichotomicum]SFJ80413.1 MFS transporter, YNFM family, putative membrane transport protein [Thermoflavimicrobium dichotomicum]
MIRLFLTFIATTNAFIILYAPQPLLPLFVQEFHISMSTASLTISVTIMGLMIASFGLATFSDRWDRKKLILIANMSLVVPSMALYFASSFFWVLIWRLLQGVFIACVTSMLMAYASEEFPNHQRGRIMGIYVSATVTGGLLGRVLSGPIAERYSWHEVFGFIALCTLVIGILLLFLPTSQNQSKPAQQVFFSHLQNPALIGTFFIGFSQFFAFIGFFNYLPFYAQEKPFHLSVSEISALYLTYLFGVFSAPLTGFLSDRLGRRTMMAAGHLIGALGIMLTLYPSVLALIIGASILTFGNFSSQSSATAHVTDMACESKGAATSLYQCFYYLGGSLGAWLPGVIWPWFEWKGVVGLTIGFILCAIMSNVFLAGRKIAH